MRLRRERGGYGLRDAAEDGADLHDELGCVRLS